MLKRVRIDVYDWLLEVSGHVTTTGYISGGWGGGGGGYMNKIKNTNQRLWLLH